MSAIHHIDNIWDMEAGRFFAFAHRLPAYKGTIRALVENEMSTRQRRTGTTQAPTPLVDPARQLGGLIDVG